MDKSTYLKRVPAPLRNQCEDVNLVAHFVDLAARGPRAKGTNCRDVLDNPRANATNKPL